MGMYTELNIGVQFKENTPNAIIDAISYMADTEQEQGEPTFPTDHPLFEEDGRWTWMLNSAGSYYFDAKATKVWIFDTIANAWFLTLCTNIKNYEDEWANFLNFIAPHISTQGYIGTYRYEEDDCPKLIFIKDGEAHLVDVSDNQEVKELTHREDEEE